MFGGLFAAADAVFEDIVARNFSFDRDVGLAHRRFFVTDNIPDLVNIRRSQPSFDSNDDYREPSPESLRTWHRESSEKCGTGFRELRIS